MTKRKMKKMMVMTEGFMLLFARRRSVGVYICHYYLYAEIAGFRSIGLLIACQSNLRIVS